MAIPEANLVRTDGGLEPTGQGWFVVNVRDTCWWHSEEFGAACPFEGNDERRRRTSNASAGRFPELGISLTVLEPGQPTGIYHGENAQEDFLVLHGECLLLVEGQERRLVAWDFVHCPPWTEHVFVGAGNGTSVLLMVGRRRSEGDVLFPVSELARRYGAGVGEETSETGVAYARHPHWRRASLDREDLLWSPETK